MNTSEKEFYPTASPVFSFRKFNPPSKRQNEILKSMSGNNLAPRIPKLGGTRQLPYAALAVAATTVTGVWMASKNNASKNSSSEEEEDSTRFANLAASTSNRDVRANETLLAENEKTSASLFQAVQDNIAKSSLNLLGSSATPCLCQRASKQVPGGNRGSYFPTQSVHTPNKERVSKPKSVLTQDKTTALVRKHATLRLLDKYKTQTSVDSKYTWNKDKIVGSGAYSQVFKAKSKETGEIVALKNISKKYTDSQYFQQEVEAMLYIQERGGHPHVISLHEHFEDGDFFILILDFIQGGELFDHLIEMGAYSENDAARIVRQVASALLFLHGIGLVHADLKPEVSSLFCVYQYSLRRSRLVPTHSTDFL